MIQLITEIFACGCAASFIIAVLMLGVVTTLLGEAARALKGLFK